MKKTRTFSRYDTFIIVALTLIQFTVILDFVILSPLGVKLLDELKITTGQFGLVVSAYAFSAFLSGILSAGFADRFDRKKYLLFFYVGFIGGTVFCAMAQTYEALLAARIITGIFGGVISSIGFAIVTDLFKVEVRGRVMGFLQMAFAASQVLGIPIGLALANKFGWHSSFWMIVGFGIPLGILMVIFMRPVNEHLKIKSNKNAFNHLISTAKKSDHIKAYLATILLATGGFMLMPFGSAFSTHNLGIPFEDLKYMYGVTGAFTIVIGPLIGKMSDSIGRFKIFFAGTIITAIIVSIYTQLGITPLWICIALNVIMFIGITARIISNSALISVIPQPQDRGAFMSINSSLQQLAGGISSAIAGQIVFQRQDGYIEHYPTLGMVVLTIMVVSTILVWKLDIFIKNRPKAEPMKTSQAPSEAVASE